MMEGWKEVKLKDICNFKYGKNLPAHSRIEGEYPVFGSSGIVSYHKDYLLEGPGIIIGRKGTVGKVQYTRENYYPIDTTYYIEEDKSKVDFKFLYYCLPLCGLETMNSDAAVPGLNRTAAINQKMLLPPLPTQRKIASILSAYDDLIENNLQRIKLLEEMAQQTYTEWFVRMKFPRHESVEWDEESGLPVGWEKVKLGDFVKTSSGGTPSRRKLTEYYEKGTIPWVRTGELRNFMLIDSEEKITKKGLQYSSAKMYPKNTVLLAMYGNTIGETTFLSFEASSNQACCAFLTDGDNSLSYYLHQFFLNSKTYVLGFRMGAAQENISQQLIKSMEIVNPTELLLKSFGVEMEKVYTTIENLLKQNQRLKEARDILLPRLMMGVIEVSEL